MAFARQVCAGLLLAATLSGADEPLTPDQMNKLGANPFEYSSTTTEAPPVEAVPEGLFSEDNCKGMFETKMKLGGSVPPNDFVPGCTEVCQKVKDIKEYWKTGDMATFACEQGAKYGCVWDG